MARRNTARIQFDALSLEGAILPPEWLARVAALDAPSQKEADYGIPKGLQLRDEIGRYWRVAQAIWADFVAARGGNDADGAARRLTRELLTQVFGFADLAHAGERNAGGRVFLLAFEALGGRVPVVVGPPTESLDQNALRHGDGTRRRSAWGALQEYLNAADGALWGFATNGLCVRLGRDNASLTRPAWLEADLERIFTEERFADFSVLWLLLHSSRFGRAGQPVQEAPLEQWREAGRQEGSQARGKLRDGVEEALQELGQGFLAHPSNRALREALERGALAPAEYFNELLRVVYRMIFLLTVEERGTLHRSDAKPEAIATYRDGYGMRRLRERSVRNAAHDLHSDLWLSLKPVFTGLGQPCGEEILALPGLGGLFGPDQCSHLDTAALHNRTLLTAVFRLSWLREGNSLARVNWKDMGVEEFGSVYESLLELVPVVSDGGRKFHFAGREESAANARKRTGSYYTPDTLVQQLLETTLEPQVSRLLAEHPSPLDAERALLSLSVVDPACGSGHFLLAAARRLAGHLARLRVGGTPGAVEYRHALRDVVVHCIYGVDRNPMAIELARTALWLEAYTPDRALSFLDHHLVCGDALLGLVGFKLLANGIPDEAFDTLPGSDKDVAALLKKLNRAGRKSLEKAREGPELTLSLGAKTLSEAWRELESLPDDGVESVEAKRRAYADLKVETSTAPSALAADIFTAAFLTSQTLEDGEHQLTELAARARFPSTSALVSVLEGTMTADHTVVQQARRACNEARVLHWSITFPDIFSRGGFDVALGNPPWEQLEIAEDWTEAQHENAAKAQSFMTSSGRYPLSGAGRKNLYALFTETVLQILCPSGRAGLVVPTGIVTDQPSEELCRAIVTERRIVSLFDFENQGRHFQAVHRQQRFALLTVVAAGQGPLEPTFGFDLDAVSDITQGQRSWRMAAIDIARMSPARFSVPMFRESDDAALCATFYRGGVTIKELKESALWIGSGLLFNADEKAKKLRRHISSIDKETTGEAWVRVYEGTYFNAFDHRYAYAAGTRIESSTDSQRADPNWEPWTEYVMPRSALQRWEEVSGRVPDWYVGMRRQARVSDGMTGIAAVLPLSVAEGNTSVFWGPGAEGEHGAALCACINSLAFNYVLRLRQSGANVSKSIYEQIPLPPFWGTDSHAQTRKAVATLSAALSYTSLRLKGFAAEQGLSSISTWEPSTRALMKSHIEALIFRAYGLDRSQLLRVLDTFPVLERREEASFGEYRTKRLVVEAWDSMTRA